MDKKQHIIHQLLLSASVVALGISAPSFTSYAATCTGTQSRTIECKNHLGVTINEDICNAFATRVGEKNQIQHREPVPILAETETETVVMIADKFHMTQMTMV